MPDDRARTNKGPPPALRRGIASVFDGAHFFLLRPQSRFWFPRLYLCLDIMVTAMIALFSAFSLNRIAFTGNFGLFALGLLVTLAIIGLLDVFLNDLMSERWHAARHHRWMIYMGMALIFGAFIYANLNNPLLIALLIRYFLCVMVALSLAGLDLLERGEETVTRFRRLSDLDLK